MNRVALSLLVPEAVFTGFEVPAVRVHYHFAFGCLSIPFRLQSMSFLREGEQRQMWEFIPI